MKIKSKTTQTFELSDEDIKEAIRELIEKQYGKGQPIAVRLSVKTTYEGCGTAEGPDYVPVITAERQC